MADVSRLAIFLADIGVGSQYRFHRRTNERTSRGEVAAAICKNRVVALDAMAVLNQPTTRSAALRRVCVELRKSH